MGTICTSTKESVKTEDVVKRKKSKKTLNKQKINSTDPDPERDVEEEEVKKLMNWVGIDSKEKAEKVIVSTGMGSIDKAEHSQSMKNLLARAKAKKESEAKEKMGTPTQDEQKENYVKVRAPDDKKSDGGQFETYMKGRGFKIDDTKT